MTQRGRKRAESSDRFIPTMIYPRIHPGLGEHCRCTTQTSRDFMENSTFQKLPDDYVRYPGKMDHTTIITFRAHGLAEPLVSSSSLLPSSPSRLLKINTTHARTHAQHNCNNRNGSPPPRPLCRGWVCTHSPTSQLHEWTDVFFVAAGPWHRKCRAAAQTSLLQHRARALG